MGAAYYNELDPYAAHWLRNLIAAGHIAPGDVDERSIVDVQADDLKGYAQAHFFAGIGGWSYAARLAGFPDDRPLWTGSCPCQPFSVAGKGAGASDERHLWPAFFALIAAVRPPVVMGEQVAAAVGKDWLDGVSADMEGIGYACGAAVVPACAVDAPHRRDRLWFIANRGAEALVDGLGSGLEGQRRHGDDGRKPGRFDQNAAGPIAEASCAVSDAECARLLPGAHPGIHRREEGEGPRHVEPVRRASAWDGAAFVVGADGKARRVEPSIRLLAHGVPARVGKLRAYGNAIVPQVAAEVIGAYLDAESLAA